MNIRWNPPKWHFPWQKNKTEIPLSRRVEEQLNALRRDSGKQSIGRTEAMSPAKDMSSVFCLIGWVARALVLFAAIYGTALFLCDAVRLVELTGKRPISEIVVENKSLLITSAALAIFFSAAAWNRLTSILLPIAGFGGLALYYVNHASDPLRYLLESLRMTADVALTNLAQIGYTAYVKYMYEGTYAYGNIPEELVENGVFLVLLFFGLLYAMGAARKVRPVLIGAIFVLQMVPVFMFNITANNKGFGWLLAVLCAFVCLWIYDSRYGTLSPEKEAKKLSKLAAKEAAKAARLHKKEEKRNFKLRCKLAYLTVIRDGGKAKTARAARKKLIKDAKSAAKQAKITAAADAKRQKADAKKAKLAAKSEAKAAKKAEADKRRSLTGDKAAMAAYKANAKADKKSRFAEKKRQLTEKIHAARSARLARNKKIAGGGFVGAMAMVTAFVAIWLPLSAIEENFPIIDAINNRMQIARMYVTAYLMGDDVDLNSLSLYGGVSDLNPRTVSFDSPQFTGQRIFTVDSGYAAPVYLRSWMGMNYDIETDSWTSADADKVLDYRSRFGSAWTPDTITTAFNGYVYPKSIDVTRFDQYRNLDAYGFRVFQVNLRRTAGNSKLLFVPAVMNTNLGIMEHGSIAPVELKYSAYFDGIYSSRFFGMDDGYSTSSFIPVMKDPNLGENLEKSIDYYNMALSYAEQIDLLEDSAEQGIYYVEEDGYTQTNGQLYVTDWAGMVADFESWAKNDLGYKWEGDSLVYRYLGMDDAQRKALWRSHEKELAYREYVDETYTATFGSEKIRTLALDILADNDILKLETDTMLTAEDGTILMQRASSLTEQSNFVDMSTGESIPRHNVILAVIQYLRDNFTYSLEPDVPMKTILDEEGNETEVPDLTSESALEAFLFEVKEGYCVHFATSAAAILRELGFAVRYTEGYIADGFARTYAADAVARYRTGVRDSDAHAWVEVYYPNMGWIQYETTPSFCESMYDADHEEEATGSSSSGGSSYIGGGMTEETEVEEIEEEVEDYTTEILICIAVFIVLLMLFSIVSWILKKRAEKAADRRAALIRQTAERSDYLAGRVNVHETARAIIDCIFALFRGLGRPNNLGEQPSEYALRLSEEFGSLSNRPLPKIMEIIEREEFGGTLSWQDLHDLGAYLDDITAGAYAGLPWRQKIRMRYFLALL